MFSFAALSEMSHAKNTGLIPIALGELFGPVPCDICQNNAWFIWLSESEYVEARKRCEATNCNMASQVISSGMARCSQHRPGVMAGD